MVEIPPSSIITYRPVLFHPKPFAPTNEVGSKTKHIVDPGFPRRGTVIRIMLDIEANERLRHTVNNGQQKGSFGCDPKVLQTKEESNVKSTPEKPTRGSELTSTAHNLEDFLLDLSFKWGIKLVPAKEQHNIPTVSTYYDGYKHEVSQGTPLTQCCSQQPFQPASFSLGAWRCGTGESSCTEP
jgi:hypothetical protein